MSTRRPASRVASAVPVESGSNGQRNSVVLGPADRLIGQLFIEGDLRVSGTVDGTLEATGDIVISDGGKVNGEVTAYNRLVVGSAGSLIGGNVRVARLTVEDGARFSGRVSMGASAEAAPPAVEPAVVPVAQPAPPVAETVEIKLPEPKKKRR